MRQLSKGSRLIVPRPQDEATIPAEPLPKSKEELPPGGKLWCL